MRRSPTTIPARMLGGIGDVAEFRRPVTLDGVVVLASPRSPAPATTIETLCVDEGWSVVRASTPDAASWAAAARKASLVVITGADALFIDQTVRAVREATTSPLAVLASLPDVDRMKVLSAGADLVLTDALHADELRLHLTALLRRAAVTWEPPVRYLVSDPLTVDLWAREFIVGGAELHLSPTEFDLVVYLMRHPRQAVPIEKIIQQVWRSRAYRGQLNAARIAICRTRTKLAQGGSAHLIRSVRGVGYEFAGPVAEVGDSANDRSGLDLGSLRLSSELLDIAEALRSLPFFDAARFCLDAMVATASGSAGAIYCNVDDQIVLLAERGNPEELCEFMRHGMSLKGRSQVHTLDERQPTQIEDLASLPTSSQTVQIMSRNGFRSYLYVPLVADGQAWGGMRLANRTRRPFDPVVTTFCSAVGAMLSLKLPAMKATGSTWPNSLL